MGRITYGRGSMRVEVDDRTDELVRRAIERVAPGLLGRVEEEMRAIFSSAKGDWPVGPDKAERGNKHSRDMLGWEAQIDPDGSHVRGRVFNTAYWAPFIRPKGHGGKKARIVFLRTPLLKRQQVLVRDLGRYVKAGLEG